MRKGQGAGTEAEFNILLDEIIALVGFTPDKDVFKAFYSAQLAKRLLLGRSASDDMERNMIIKLQRGVSSAHQASCKLTFRNGGRVHEWRHYDEGSPAIREVRPHAFHTDDSLVKSYQTHLAKSDQSDPTSLSANVLTESAWPAYPLLKDGWAFKLPPKLQGSVDQFSAWYNVQHKNRQLSWRWQLATVTMIARFGGKRYEVGVSLFQAVVLMCFDEEDTLGFEAIRERTGIGALTSESANGRNGRATAHFAIPFARPKRYTRTPEKHKDQRSRSDRQVPV